MIYPNKKLKLLNQEKVRYPSLTQKKSEIPQNQKKNKKAVKKLFCFFSVIPRIVPRYQWSTFFIPPLSMELKYVYKKN